MLFPTSKIRCFILPGILRKLSQTALSSAFPLLIKSFPLGIQLFFSFFFFFKIYFHSSFFYTFPWWSSCSPHLHGSQVYSFIIFCFFLACFWSIPLLVFIKYLHCVKDTESDFSYFPPYSLPEVQFKYYFQPYCQKQSTNSRQLPSKYHCHSSQN